MVQGVELESYLPTPEALLGQMELATISIQLLLILLFLVQGVELESYLPTPEALLGQEELATLSS